jgi:cytochrome c biogenesis protein CcmG, thiol:disulfide interchange protein DsbE
MPSATKRRAMEQQQRRRQIRTLGMAAAIVAAIAVVAVVINALGGEDTTEPGVVQTRPVTVTGEALPAFGPDPDPAVGMTAPSLAGEAFDGSPVSITPGDGPMAVWFVAHWCPHCQAEVPRIVALADQGKLPEGVDVTAVSTSVDPAAPNYPPSTWLEDQGWPFPVMADDESGTAASAYGLQGFPFLVLVDADGNVVSRSSGELGDDGIIAALESIAG